MLLASLLCGLLGAIVAFTLTWGLSRSPSARESHKAAPALAFVGSTTLSLFVLVLGFLVASSWQEHSAARDHTYSEARALTAAYSAAGALGPADRSEVRASLRTYTESVIGEEWAAMAEQRASATAWQALDHDHTMLQRIASQGPGGSSSSATTATSKALDDAYQMRGQRLSDMRWAVPSALLFALVATALLVLLFPALVGINAGPRHLMMMVLLGAVLGFGIYLVFNLQHPFSGPVGVDSSAYQQAQGRFAQLDGE
jgi:hypothetical protein